MLTKLKTWLLKNRIAATSIAIEQTERAKRCLDAKIERLAQREIDLRIQYSRRDPLPHARHIINLPGDR